MEFEWDEAKSDACFQQRGFDFAYVLHCFVDPHRLIAPDARFDYGEDRFQLIGRVEHRVFFVVYTLRGAAIRIISARKANQREVKRYEDQN
jgi:uncharacterized DUF497 family protein